MYHILQFSTGKGHGTSGNVQVLSSFMCNVEHFFLHSYWPLDLQNSVSVLPSVSLCLGILSIGTQTTILDMYTGV